MANATSLPCACHGSWRFFGGNLQDEARCFQGRAKESYDVAAVGASGHGEGAKALMFIHKHKDSSC